MNFLITIFNVLLYQPLFNALILLYKYLPPYDFGVSIIALTLIIRFLLYPSAGKAIKSQKALSDIQPKIQEIQKKYKGDRQRQAQATMELYKKENVNPFSGCLPMLIQLPILLALFSVLRNGFSGTEPMRYLYSFISPPPLPFNSTFLGLFDLSKPFIPLAILTGVVQFLQAKMMTPKNKKSSSKDSGSNFSKMMQTQMVYFFPFMIILMVWYLPSAIALYWATSMIFAVVQQFLILRKSKAINH